MFEFSALPILAAGIGDLIPIGFLVLMVISWIVNLLKDNKPAPPPPRRAPRPRGGGKLQNEIEMFLQEVGGKQRQQNRPREIEVFETEQPPPRQRPKFEPPRRRKPVPKPPAEKPPEHLSEHHLAKSNLGKGVDDYVQQHMKKKQRPKRKLHSDIREEVIEDLGAGERRRTSESPKLPKRKSQAAAQVLKLLQSPQGAQHAIILSEILKKPRALGRRSSDTGLF